MKTQKTTIKINFLCISVTTHPLKLPRQCHLNRYERVVPFIRHCLYIPSTFKNPPFIARIFYRRALYPRAFSLAAQFTLLQRLEIADSSCAFAPSPPAKATRANRGILERGRYNNNPDSSLAFLEGGE